MAESKTFCKRSGKATSLALADRVYCLTCGSLHYGGAGNTFAVASANKTFILVRRGFYKKTHISQLLETYLYNILICLIYI